MRAPEILSLPIIESALSTSYIGRGTNELHDEIGSTNTRCAELAAAGAPEGTVVIARQQTAGRGRQGKAWSAPPDAGISFSCLLRPHQAKIPLNKLPLVTLATGVACARAIESSSGIRLGLKWVNDLTANGKKVGGILAEMPGQALVIGIGINIRLDVETLPEEIKERVDWLENLAGAPVDPNLVVVELCSRLEDEYEKLKAGDTAGILEAWRAYSVSIGRDVIARSGTREIYGHTIGLADSGALLLKTPDGELVELSAGEISLRMADGSYC